jgi:hypothetical protein
MKDSKRLEKMLKPLKILQISNFDYKRNFHHFYNCDYKIYFGLIKNNHAVYQYSNRDIARQEGFFKSRLGSKKIQNEKLLKIVSEIKPDIIIIGHADKIDNETLLQIKSENNNTKIIGFNVDALWVEHNLNLVKNRCLAVDAMFLTTAGNSLKQFERDGLILSYIPNPTDSSIDKYKCFENSNFEHDVFFAGGGENRLATCNFLKSNLTNFKFKFLGQNNIPLTYGQNYFDSLTTCWAGINLPQFTDEIYQPYLYSSDRISQFIVNGLLTFIHRKTGINNILKEDEEAIFYESDIELANKLEFYKNNMTKAKTIASNGWEKYHKEFSSEKITRYMLNLTLENLTSEQFFWPQN